MANMPQNTNVLPGRATLHSLKTASSINPDGNEPGLVFREMAHLGKLNLRAKTSAGKAVKLVTGCTFPPNANRFTQAGERRVIWLGPDEFLIICEPRKEEALLGTLDVELQSLHYSATNITDALTAFQLKGPACRQVLSKGCAIDLHPKYFDTGDCAQTLLSNTAITLLVISDDEFLVLCRTSFAYYLSKWLLDAALEYGVIFKN